jgi:hypothetical protein
MKTEKDKFLCHKFELKKKVFLDVKFNIGYRLFSLRNKSARFGNHI